MTQPVVLDGKLLSAKIRSDLTGAVAGFVKAKGVKPGLAVVLVGEHPASQVYVRNKAKQTVEVGMESFEHKLPETTPQADLLALIDKLNADRAVHGILVQLPLPAHIEAGKVINRIHPDKDVDGFSAVNVGRLSIGMDGFVPCTPLGCLKLLHHYVPNGLAGKHAVVLGRSNIVGKPMAALLLQNDCTVTIAHSKTKDLAAITRQADILVAAIGRAKFVTADMVKPGAVVIDVGINRAAGANGKDVLVGDVDYAAVSAVAGAITPVPGGVGPMTIACLLSNTLDAAMRIVP
ncbi:MAG: bifunctional methylenetetrahydrofolate dehydrogenase/methenyltetrahydrofolate cyclohydrolase FolD [Holosporales bacterium]|jgi:methylenetetrahydrofolate dehydrogenase (NADP+)/methenyltetrahydrofolate cyclohydrolase